MVKTSPDQTAVESLHSSLAFLVETTRPFLRLNNSFPRKLDWESKERLAAVLACVCGDIDALVKERELDPAWLLANVQKTPYPQDQNRIGGLHYRADEGCVALSALSQEEKLQKTGPSEALLSLEEIILSLIWSMTMVFLDESDLWDAAEKLIAEKQRLIRDQQLFVEDLLEKSLGRKIAQG